MISFLRARIRFFSIGLAMIFAAKAMAHDPETVSMKILKSGQIGLFDSNDMLPFYTFDVSEMGNVNWALASALSLEMPLNVSDDNAKCLRVGKNGVPGYYVLDPRHFEVRVTPNELIEFWFVKGSHRFKVNETPRGASFQFNDLLREALNTNGLIILGHSEKPFLTRWKHPEERLGQGDPIHEWTYAYNPGGTGWLQLLRKEDLLILKPRALRRKKIAFTPEQKVHIEALESERGDGNGVIVCIKARCPAQAHEVQRSCLLMGRNILSKKKAKKPSKSKAVPSARELPIYSQGWVPPQNPAYQNRGPDEDYAGYPSLELGIAKAALGPFSN